jgi:hypothetical protein
VNTISKIKIYKTMVKSIVMYGCETWSMTEKDKIMLNIGCFKKSFTTLREHTNLYRGHARFEPS